MAEDLGGEGWRQERKEINVGVGEEGCGEGGRGRCSLLHVGSGGDERRRRRGRRKEAASYLVSSTTGLTEDWEAATEEAFAREGGTSGGRRRLPAHDWAWRQGRRRRIGRQETGKEGAGGSAFAASRRKQRRRKRPRSMAATASWEGGTGGLMETETRPTATEKSEGREDPHDVGDEVFRGSGDSITEEKGGGVCGDGREGREGEGRRWGKREEREKRQGGRQWKRGRRGRRSRG